MSPYTALSTVRQDFLDPVENLSAADIIGNAQESRQFRSRLTFGELRRGICQDYETGCVDAMGTIRRLEIGGLLTSPEDFCAIYCAGVRALEEGARS